MQQDTNLSSVTFSPQLIELKQKLVQPSVLNFQEGHLNHIDTEKLKIPKQKIIRTPEQDKKQMERALLRQIDSSQDIEKLKQKQIKVQTFIERERYLLPPVNNIRKIIKSGSFKSKNEEIINSYMEKDLINFVTPIKKKNNKAYNSTTKIESQLEAFLKKSKSKNKRLIYYRPEQVRKHTLHKEDYVDQHDSSNRHMKSEVKLSAYNVLRKRTKTEMKSHNKTEQFDFFKLETCFNKPEYVFFDSISTANKVNSSRISRYNRVLSLPTQEDLKEFLNKYQPANEQIQIKTLLKSNFCSVQFSKHEVYVGEMSRKVRSGTGILFTKQYYFEGLWKNNQKIRGVEITKDGIYKGYYQDNRREGSGEYLWDNGQLYVGEWLKGHQHGQGLWINPRGQSYNGEWKHGKADGIGSLIIKNTHNTKSGRKYKGAFVSNKQHGFGRQSFINGDSYEGLYRDDQPLGKGTYIWANGSIYEGQFNCGMRMGMGILKTSFNLTYKGQFIDDCPNGECEIILPNGDTYYGMVNNGKKNGKGTLHIRKSKQTFNGYWQNDYFVSHDTKE